jgi:hypothetical protein
MHWLGLCLVMAVLLSPTAATARTLDCTTNGLLGTNWNQASNWSGCNVGLTNNFPNNSGSNYFSATLAGGNSHDTREIILNSGVTIGGGSTAGQSVLYVGSYNLLNLKAGLTFTTSASAAPHDIINNGAMTLNSGGQLVLGGTSSSGSPWTIYNTGTDGPRTITLAAGGTSIAAASGVTSYLSIKGQTINKTGTGSATIGGTAGNLYVTTDGATTINASAGTLVINTPGFTNGGKITATGSGTGSYGTIQLLNSNFQNSGTISATGYGKLIIDSSRISGGTVTSAGNSTIELKNSSTLGALTLTNAGTLNATSGTNQIGDTSGAAVTFNNSGTVNVTGGSLRLEGNGRGTWTNSGTLDANGGTLTLASLGLTNSGTLKAENGGTLALNGATINGGTLTIASGSTLQTTGGTSLVQTASGLTLAGNVNVAGGSTLHTTGALTLAGTSTVNVANGSTFQSDSTITNDGAVTIDAGGKIIASAASDYSNSYIQNGGTTTVAGTLQAGAGGNGNVAINAGVLNGSGMIDGNVVVNNSGTLQGTLAIDGDLTINSGGTLSIGNSPGITTVAGDYTMTSGSNWLIDIAGANPGTGYDQLQVGGTANLNGLWTILLDDSFTTWTAGEKFAILVASAISGTPSSIVAPEGWRIDYTAGEVDLYAPGGSTSTPEPATYTAIAGGLLAFGAILRRRRAK